jgi:hypothetical protein
MEKLKLNEFLRGYNFQIPNFSNLVPERPANAMCKQPHHDLHEVARGMLGYSANQNKSRDSHGMKLNFMD